MRYKILYIHGFSSSGSSFTPRTMARVMPDANIISPDVPLDPEKALTLLRDICAKEQPDIVIGTSMGGMFAQQMHGFPKILVNPSFEVSRVLKLNKGTNEFMFPREDGEQTFEVTDELIAQYEAMEERQFDFIEMVDLEHTWAMFGTEDTVVNARDVYEQHYDNYIIFEGEHMLHRRNIENDLMPLIQRVLEK